MMRYIGYINKVNVLEGEDLLPEILEQINSRREELNLSREDMIDEIEVTLYDQVVAGAMPLYVASVKVNDQSHVPLIDSGGNIGFKAKVSKDETAIKNIILEHNCDEAKAEPFNYIIVKYAYMEF